MDRLFRITHELSDRFQFFYLLGEKCQVSLYYYCVIFFVAIVEIRNSGCGGIYVTEINVNEDKIWNQLAMKNVITNQKRKRLGLLKKEFGNRKG